MALLGGLVPQHQGDERTLLLDYLTRQRELVFWKVDGLDDTLARTVGTPSGMTAAGILTHLENVERAWLRRHFAGQEVTIQWDDGITSDMAVPSAPLSQVLADYRAEIALCDEVIAGADLDAVSVNRDHSLRWILLHLIEEIARHVGHLDLLTEQADGRVGEEPEGAPPPGVNE